MRELLVTLGFFALVQGIAGLGHEFGDWDWGLVRRYDVLDGYEVYVSAALVVLALALFAAAHSRKDD
jgi:hypothetical protein